MSNIGLNQMVDFATLRIGSTGGREKQMIHSGSGGEKKCFTTPNGNGELHEREKHQIDAVLIGGSVIIDKVNAGEMLLALQLMNGMFVCNYSAGRKRAINGTNREWLQRNAEANVFLMRLR